MIYASPVSFLMFMVVALLFTGCFDNRDEPAIDQSYLESEHYQQFEQRSVKERTYRSDEATAFKRILTNLLTDPQTREINLPLHIDSLALDTYLNSSEGFELKQSMINEPAELNYTYYPVGKTRKADINVLFFLIRKQSVYSDVDLAMATFKDTSIIEVQSIGEFKRNLSLRVGSYVKVDHTLDVISEINRKPLYPVPQEYNTIYKYIIDTEGEIEEEVISKDS